MLTLHLLDSKPLDDALSTFLAQRAKAVVVLLSDSTDSPPANKKGTHLANGHHPGLFSDVTRTRKAHVKDVRTSIQAAMEAVTRTLTSTRAIFDDSSSSEPSLMRRTLEYMHNTSSKPPPSQHLLPPELMLSTQLLLTSLPSSTYLLLLPQNVRSYKPYVAASAAATVSQTSLTGKLEEWFTKAAQSLQAALSRWLADIKYARDLWKIRTRTRKWLSNCSGLRAEETSTLNALLNNGVCQRIVDIWHSTLMIADSSFQDTLRTNIDAASSSHSKGTCI